MSLGQQVYLAVLPPQPVGYPLALDGLKALEVQNALCILVTCRIPLLGCLHISHASLQYVLHL